MSSTIYVTDMIDRFMNSLNSVKEKPGTYDEFRRKIGVTKFELLVNSGLFRSGRETIENYVNNENIVNNLLCIDILKLDLLLSSYLCKFINSTQPAIMRRIIENQRITSAINSVDITKLTIVVEAFPPSHLYRIESSIINETSLDALNLIIDVKKLKILLNYDVTCDYCENVIKEILKNRSIIEAINSLDIKVLELIIDNGKFNGVMLSKIFANSLNIYKIKTMGIGMLKISLQGGSLCMNILHGKARESTGSEVDLIFEDDKYFHMCDKYEGWKEFHKMDHDKLEEIIESDLFDPYDLLNLIKHPGSIEKINSMDINKLISLLNFRQVFVPAMIRKPGKWYFREKCNYSKENRILDKMHKNSVLSVFLNYDFIDYVNDIDTQRLVLLLKHIEIFKDYDNEQHFSSYVMNLQSFLRSKLINFVDMGKLEILLKRYDDLKDVSHILTRHYEIIEKIEIERFARLTKMIEARSLNHIFENYEKIPKINWDLTLALFKAGLINGKVDYSFLVNTRKIERRVIKAFPEGHAIDQILIPSSIKNEGRVRNLKYLCLDVAMGVFNNNRMKL